MTNITIGADPEVFISNAGNVVPVVGHLGGTKAEPLPVIKGALQEDNVLAEFNIDPARTGKEFAANIKTVMGQLRERLYPMDIVVKSSHMFEKNDLLRSGRQALLFGCDPDYNAYTGERNPVPSARTCLRTAGGHIHVGYDNSTEEQNRAIVRSMDVYLGLPSLLLDDDTMRRQMYGRAGCYRTKSYGVEYRSLSNFWLRHTDLIEWAFEQSVEAYNNPIDTGSQDIDDIINSNNKTAAEFLIKKYGIRLP